LLEIPHRRRGAQERCGTNPVNVFIDWKESEEHGADVSGVHEKD